MHQSLWLLAPKGEAAAGYAPVCGGAFPPGLLDVLVVQLAGEVALGLELCLGLRDVLRLLVEAQEAAVALVLPATRKDSEQGQECMRERTRTAWHAGAPAC